MQFESQGKYTFHCELFKKRGMNGNMLNLEQHQ